MKYRILGLVFMLFSIGGVVAQEIVYKDSEGNVLTKSELENYSGEANWEISLGKSISSKAKELHAEARKMGQQGEYDNSIELLRKASDLEPKWAYPIYDMAFTYMLKNNYEKALELYRKVDKMESRGFFTTKTAIYTLEGESSGKYPKGLYMAYLSLEWMDKKEKSELILKLINNFPNYAAAWKELAALAGNDETAMQAIEQGLSANPDAETYGLLMINKALVLSRGGEQDKAISMLGALGTNSKSTIATVMLAKETIANLLSK